MPCPRGEPYWSVPQPRPPATPQQVVQVFSSFRLLNLHRKFADPVDATRFNRKPILSSLPSSPDRTVPDPMTISAMDVFKFPIAIDDQGRRMCDVDRVHAQLVIQPISLGHCAVLIEQKGIRHAMRSQQLRRLRHPRTFLRRDVHQLRSCMLDLSFHWLQLSHAFYAVRSPGTAQELHDQSAARQETGKRENPVTVRRRQQKFWCP